MISTLLLSAMTPSGDYQGTKRKQLANSTESTADTNHHKKHKSSVSNINFPLPSSGETTHITGDKDGAYVFVTSLKKDHNKKPYVALLLPKDNKYDCWCPLGGQYDRKDNKSLIMTAIREVIEETGDSLSFKEQDLTWLKSIARKDKEQKVNGKSALFWAHVDEDNKNAHETFINKAIKKNNTGSGRNEVSAFRWFNLESFIDLCEKQEQEKNSSKKIYSEDGDSFRMGGYTFVHVKACMPQLKQIIRYLKKE